MVVKLLVPLSAESWPSDATTFRKGVVPAARLDAVKLAWPRGVEIPLSSLLQAKKIKPAEIAKAGSRNVARRDCILPSHIQIDSGTPGIPMGGRAHAKRHSWRFRGLSRGDDEARGVRLRGCGRGRDRPCSGP